MLEIVKAVRESNSVQSVLLSGNRLPAADTVVNVLSGRLVNEDKENVLTLFRKLGLRFVDGAGDWVVDTSNP